MLWRGENGFGDGGEDVDFDMLCCAANGGCWGVLMR